LYTTYEDDPERQVFVAEYLLKRAKRYAECGSDVLVLVDSLSALARAYNDTDASIGGKMLVGGMESKTIQYLKRFFGTARCFEKGGSVTILGTVTVDSGNPADDLISAELSAIGNYEVCLNEQLARKRIYPAIELSSSKTNKSGLIVGTRGDNLDFILRNEYLPKYSQEELYELLFDAKSYEDFEESVIRKVKSKK
jgi:transcription termination factor Rho